MGLRHLVAGLGARGLQSFGFRILFVILVSGFGFPPHGVLVSDFGRSRSIVIILTPARRPRRFVR
jgi:hypothetical protein